MRNVQYDIDCGNDCVIQKTMLYTEANEAIARSEAIGGAYTVVDTEDPPRTLTFDERIAELEEALALLLSGVTE